MSVARLSQICGSAYVRCRALPVLRLATGLLFSCSAAVSGEEKGEERSLEYPNDGVQEEVRRTRFEELRDAELSDYEHEILFGALEQRGADVSRYSTWGRFLVYDDDVLLSADELLTSATINKGRVLSSVVDDRSGFGSRCGTSCGHLAPDVFALVPRGQPDRLLWHRPDTESTYYIVFPDTAPDWLSVALESASSSIENAIGASCLNSETDLRGGEDLFVPIRASDHTALPAGTKLMTYRIDVMMGPFAEVCPTLLKACSNFPRVVAAPFRGMHLRFGDRIGIPTGEGTFFLDGDNDPTEASWALTHELLHLMGFAHPEVNFTTSIAVPGTFDGETDSQQVTSVMRGSEDPFKVDFLSTSEDDLNTLGALYQTDCTYSSRYRNIAP